MGEKLKRKKFKRQKNSLRKRKRELGNCIRSLIMTMTQENKKREVINGALIIKIMSLVKGTPK